MKVKEVRYEMLRVTGRFENDRAGVTVELERGDTVEKATEKAKAECEKMLGIRARGAVEDAIAILSNAKRPGGKWRAARDALAVLQEASE